MGLLRNGIGRSVHLIESTDLESEQDSDLVVTQNSFVSGPSPDKKDGTQDRFRIRAMLEEAEESSRLSVLFLLSSLAFLEAKPSTDRSSEVGDPDSEPEGQLDGQLDSQLDGWTPTDFISYLRLDRDGSLKIELNQVRGRAVKTAIRLRANGELCVETRDRGQSANRWIHFVRGKSHLASV